MRVESVRATPGVAAFYSDDQRAIKAGAERDGFAYDGDPVTAGFDRIREPGESLLLELELSDGSTVRGDCAAVQYAGAGGRDPPLDPGTARDVVEGPLADRLVGSRVDDFGAAVDLLSTDDHTGVRYGVSAALLAAAARATRTTRTDVLAEHLGTEPATDPIPVFGQSGERRRENAEKMCLRGTPVLPHGLFNSREAVGEDGQRLREYLSWLADRARELGPGGYDPRLHVDVYGVLGDLFGEPYDGDDLVSYLADLERAAAPFDLQVEGPMDAGEAVDGSPADARAEQIRALATLREALADASVDVDLVADEWCNTLADVEAFVDADAADVVQIKTPDLGGLQRSARAVRYCEGTPVRSYLGGTCNETATTARACAHVALATDADQVLAKPGMGFDEGYTVVTNEMRRTLARRADADRSAATEARR
jgi:methylaspartate ammonia-lyase